MRNAFATADVTNVPLLRYSRVNSFVIDRATIRTISQRNANFYRERERERGKSFVKVKI